MASESVIHIVDDDDAVRDALSVLFGVEGLTVRAYASADAFLDDPPPADARGCVVTDVHMRGMNGLQLLRSLRAAAIELPVVVITGRTGPALEAEAQAAGAAMVLEKPFSAKEIVAAVRSALETA